MGRPTGKRNVTDDAILAVLPATAAQVGNVVGLSVQGAAWRLARLHEAGAVSSTTPKGKGRARMWFRGGQHIPVATRYYPPGQVGRDLCAMCGGAVVEHSYAEVMRGCSR